VIGVQRRAYAEPFLVVQGVQRFTIKQILKERPFFEAEVVLHNERGWCTNPSPLKIYESQLIPSHRRRFQRRRNRRVVPAVETTIARIHNPPTTVVTTTFYWHAPVATRCSQIRGVHC
jgi:ATP-dependent Lon protease